MRTQRIFWILVCFIPHMALAEGDFFSSIKSFFSSPGDAITKAELVTSKAQVTKYIAEIESGGILLTPPSSLPSSAAFIKAVAAVKAASVGCISKTTAANFFCAESSAPAIGKLIADHGAEMQMIGQAAKGLAGQCSEIGKMLGHVTTALGVFQAGCAAAQAVCSSSCEALVIAQKEYLASAVAVQKEIFSFVGTASMSHPTLAQTLPKDEVTITRHIEIADLGEAKTLPLIKNCGSYEMSVKSAAAGAISALQGLTKSNSCSENTASSDSGINCNDPKNPSYNQKNCMCTRNELTAAECQNQVVGTSINKAPAIQTGGKVTFDKDGNSVPDFSPSEKGSLLAATPSSGGLPGAPSGGGGGAAGASGGSGKAQDGFAGNGGRRLNTNILGGSGGGGGGGYGSGAGYGEDPSLGAYKPGGEKDPSRTIASQLAKEVTGQGGRSNWEKVKSRYIDNSRKLLGQ